MTSTVSNHPAETGGLAGTIALLIAYFAGVTDPAIIVAIGAVVSAVPALVTFLVTLGQKRSLSAAQAAVAQKAYADQLANLVAAVEKLVEAEAAKKATVVTSEALPVPNDATPAEPVAKP